MATSPVLHCSLCSHNGTKICDRCQSSKYCSAKCQETDWPTHRILCRVFKDFASPTQNDMKRAILFSSNSKQPKFVWVPCAWVQYGGYEVVDSNSFLLNSASEQQGEQVVSRLELFTTNMIRQRRPRRTIELQYRDDFMTDGSAPNRSIKEATKGLMGYTWRGPVLALGRRGFESPFRYYEDITVADFRDVVDIFMSYGDDAVRDTAKYLNGKATGVNIACEGEVTVLGSEKFRTVEVPRQHPVFQKPLMTEVPCLLGFPLLVWRCHPDRTWNSDESISQKSLNQAATSLHFIADRDSPDWGSIPMEWQNSVGSILVVRQDGNPLSPLHMKVLCAFCQYKVGPLFKKTMQMGDERERFALFFQAYRERMAEASHEWRTVASPYAV